MKLITMTRLADGAAEDLVAPVVLKEPITSKLITDARSPICPCGTDEVDNGDAES